jgi:hypothetical protein
MDRPGAGGPDTHPQPPGMFGETSGHECRCLLVTDRNVPDLLLALSECFDDRVDAVADNPESVGHTPIDERFNNNIGGVLIVVRR